MDNEEYIKMLLIFNKYFEPLIISWRNGLKVRCRSFTGVYETDTEPGDEDYIGEYAAAVDEVEIIQEARDDSVVIDNNCIEISLISIPEKISLEDGSVLWQREE